MSNRWIFVIVAVGLAGCADPVCGNGVIEPGEYCDPGVSTGCTPDCDFARCGDGFVSEGEVCDDGNRQDGDSCPASCTICGDGIISSPETCDDGNEDNMDGCARCATSGTIVDRLDGIRGCRDFIGAAGDVLLMRCAGGAAAFDLQTDALSPVFEYTDFAQEGASNNYEFFLSDSTFLVNTQASGEPPMLTRLDLEGTVLWSATVPPSPDTRETFAQGALLLENGTIAVVGFGRPAGGTGRADAGWILQLGGSDGAIVHNRVDTSLPVFQGIAFNESGAALAVGNMVVFDEGLVSRIDADMSVVPLYALATQDVDTGLVGSGAWLRALVNPVPRSFSVIPYLASVALGETGPSEVWRVDLEGGRLRTFEQGIVVMGEDADREVVRRIDPETLDSLWELHAEAYDAIIGGDGFLYLLSFTPGSDSRFYRVVW